MPNSSTLVKKMLRLRPAAVPLVLLFALAAFSGCKGHAHISDSRLRPIQEIVDAQLPVGTTRARVELFLSSRGYPFETVGQDRKIVAVLRHIKEDTLEPVTGRVTFAFDARDRLTTYEIDAAPGSP